MNTNKNSQLQIRIDLKTKNDAKAILDGLGLDMSAAVKLFFRQVINSRNLPFELRGENGLTLRHAEALRESIADAERSPKAFRKGSALIKDALKD